QPTNGRCVLHSSNTRCASLQVSKKKQPARRPKGNRKRRTGVFPRRVATASTSKAQPTGAKPGRLGLHLLGQAQGACTKRFTRKSRRLPNTWNASAIVSIFVA